LESAKKNLPYHLTLHVQVSNIQMQFGLEIWISS